MTLSGLSEIMITMGKVSKRLAAIVEVVNSLVHIRLVHLQVSQVFPLAQL